MGQQNINAEYERIFGIVRYPILFDSDDVEYDEFRQEIIDAPRLFRPSGGLPFEDIYCVHIEKEYDPHPNQGTYNADIHNIVKGIQNHAAKIITGILSALEGFGL